MVCSDIETVVVEFNSDEDHVYLFVNSPPNFSVAKLVFSLKSVSS